MSVDSYGMSLDEAKAKSTAWAVTYADLVTLLLTFFILLDLFIHCFCRADVDCAADPPCVPALCFFLSSALTLRQHPEPSERLGSNKK